MTGKKLPRGTVQAVLRDDWPYPDQEAYGLEQWNGKAWLPLWPEHPTFANKRAADEYGAAKFKDFKK